MRTRGSSGDPMWRNEPSTPSASRLQSPHVDQRSRPKERGVPVQGASGDMDPRRDRLVDVEFDTFSISRRKQRNPIVNSGMGLGDATRAFTLRGEEHVDAMAKPPSE